MELIRASLYRCQSPSIPSLRLRTRRLGVRNASLSQSDCNGASSLARHFKKCANKAANDRLMCPIVQTFLGKCGKIIVVLESVEYLLECARPCRFLPALTSSEEFCPGLGAVINPAIKYIILSRREREQRRPI